VTRTLFALGECAHHLKAAELADLIVVEVQLAKTLAVHHQSATSHLRFICRQAYTSMVTAQRQQPQADLGFLKGVTLGTRTSEASEH